MNSSTPILKKPKLEHDNHLPLHKPNSSMATAGDEKNNGHGESERETGGEATTTTTAGEQEEAFVALIEHRTKEVEHLKKRITYYNKQLQDAETKLDDTVDKLNRLRASRIKPPPKVIKSVVKNEEGISPSRVDENASRDQSQPRTELVIPGANPKTSRPVKVVEPSANAKASVGAATHSTSRHSSGASPKVKLEGSSRSSHDVEPVEVKKTGTKRKLEQKEHKELIPLIRSSSSPRTISCYASNHISSQHKRKMRSLVVCPVNDQLFATSALDGMVNLWQIQSKGSSASIISRSDCVSSKQRRWPEDIAWHPLGNSLFSTYSADGDDSQISILNLNKTQGKSRVSYLEDRPHKKGIINSITFMPWENPCFATGGSDHAVVLWNEKGDENSWKPKSLHKELHSSAVMGVAGLQHKNIVLSAGADKRIIGFDVQMGRVEFRHQLDSKCMSVLPNPCDFNLFMVQTGIPQNQLRLFDIRLRQTEVHSFGFKQESSDSQSALINQSWSPDGLYVTSGSVDPIIHIFDIRYNSHNPSQSVRAHNKRVFKAVWHYNLPLLISISSDLHVGLHKIS